MNVRNTFGTKAAEILGGHCCTLLVLILENSGNGLITIYLHHLVLPTQLLYISEQMKDRRRHERMLGDFGPYQQEIRGGCYILTKDRLSVGDKLYFDLVLPLALLHPMEMMPLVSVHPFWADFDQARKEFEPSHCYDESCAQHKLRFIMV